ncbi:hypothetical protein ACFL24_01840 [Patescibacteria group bacterium]
MIDAMTIPIATNGIGLSFKKIPNHQSQKAFLKQMAGILAPFFELPQTDSLNIPINLTISVTNLQSLTFHLFEINEIQAGKSFNGSILFYFIGEIDQQSGFEIGRINPDGEIIINQDYIFSPRDLKKILELVPQNIGSQEE